MLLSIPAPTRTAWSGAHFDRQLFRYCCDRRASLVSPQNYQSAVLSIVHFALVRVRSVQRTFSERVASTMAAIVLLLVNVILLRLAVGLRIRTDSTRHGGPLTVYEGLQA